MKIFCIGRNYAAHAQELGNEIPEEPVIFMKPKSALLTANSPFYYPEFTNELHYEAELVLRICRNGKYVDPSKANLFYNAITVGIDFTARDIQQQLKKKGLPWEKAKAFDSSALIGGFRNVEPGKPLDPISFSLKKNDEIVQQGDSRLMMYSFDQIICDISKYFSLNIGDLIFTGTPAGVGECLVGDVLEGFLDNDSVFKMEVK